MKHKIMKKLLGLLLSVVAVTQAQHSIPFASKNNAIELSVVNTSEIETQRVFVEPIDIPKWIMFNNPKSEIKKLKSGERNTAQFTFSVDKTAPVNTPTTLHLAITNSAGEKWSKEISIQVSPPETFELFQNYPNPFNPSTIISYQLPMESKITLKIYDALGKEVITLFNGIKEAGYHQIEWNAKNVASGMYIYTLQTDKSSFIKKMIVVK
jgi:hypothetical protein